MLVMVLDGTVHKTFEEGLLGNVPQKIFFLIIYLEKTTAKSIQC